MHTAVPYTPFSKGSEFSARCGVWVDENDSV